MDEQSIPTACTRWLAAVDERCAGLSETRAREFRHGAMDAWRALRARVEREKGRLDDEVWGYLDRHHYVEEAILAKLSGSRTYERVCSEMLAQIDDARSTCPVRSK
jgi:hypothetical protein